MSTPFDFHSVIPDLVSVNYVADPQRWHFLLQIPQLWRIMFPVSSDESDDLALSPDFAQSLMANVVPRISKYKIARDTYRDPINASPKRFAPGAHFWSAMPRTSTIRWVAWA